jgi:hypothetical protein
MPERRLKWHLAKTCSGVRKHSAFFSTCPFNSLHIVPNHAFQHHLTTCPGFAEVQTTRRSIIEQPEVCWKPTWPSGPVDLNAVYIPQVASNNLQERCNNNEVAVEELLEAWRD